MVVTTHTLSKLKPTPESLCTYIKKGNISAVEYLIEHVHLDINYLLLSLDNDTMLRFLIKHKRPIKFEDIAQVDNSKLKTKLRNYIEGFIFDDL